MRAHLVNFQRGQDSKKSMDVGAYRNWQQGDRIEVLQDLYELGDTWDDLRYYTQRELWDLEKDEDEIYKILSTSADFIAGQILKYDAVDEKFFKDFPSLGINGDFVKARPDLFRRIIDK